ncbi:MAG TPA: beta-N-acetylhexosaminidase [bacterium]|nr:beta-N-acetylhexosaminidase [bacterium]
MGARGGDPETLDRQGLVGQMFMVDFSGPEPSAEVERLLTEGGVGGVVVFDKNVEAPIQVARLSNALQRLAARAGQPPLLLAADQEGGPVVRLRGTHFPSAMAFGAAASDRLVAQAARVTARELRAVGIHVNFAPVLDVNSNPANPVIGVRSYGEDPAPVARLGVQAVTAMQAAGVLATAKHFPGHGDTSLDSHLALPTVAHPRGRLEAVELLPFVAAIRAGVAAVLTAHVVYPALDPDRPATLSPAIIGVLRRELGFQGLVVSDSMRMRAIVDHYRPGDAAVEAVLAGVDLVLALGPAEAQWEAIEAVRAAAETGRIPSARLHEAAGRVLAAKRRLGLFERALVREGDVAGSVGLPEHIALAHRIAAAAATNVRDRPGAVPLPPGSVSVATGLAPGDTVARLAEALRAAGRPAASVTLGPETPPQGAIVVPIGGGAPSDPDFSARVYEVTLEASGYGPTIAVSTDVPYPLARVAPRCACLAVYGADPAALHAAAGVLTGAVRPRGRLPVTVSAAPDAA